MADDDRRRPSTDGGTARREESGAGRTSFGATPYRDADPMRPSDSPEFRHQYGYLRTYYRHRPEQYRDLQKWLNQARVGQNYDEYLADSALYAITTAIVGVVVGIALTVGLVELGVVAELRNPFEFRGDLTVYIGQNRALFTGAAVAIAVAVVAAAITWYARYYYPRYVADNRRRNIDTTLPHAITFMYALSYGGMDLLEVIERLGESEDTYSEIAYEFQLISREVDMFGNDLYTALQNTRDLTPSDNLEQFLDDLLSVLDSGGDVSVFLETETDTYLEEARDQQTGFIETLALLSEVFVVVFVAAPLFVIVLLIVMSLLGANTITQVTALVYLILPLGVAGFLVALDTLSAPFQQPDVTLETESHATAIGDAALLGAVARDFVVGAGERLAALPARLFGDEDPDLTSERYRERQRALYLRRRRRQQLGESLRTPLAGFHENPVNSVAVTIPLAAAAVAVVLTSTEFAYTQETFLADPLVATAWLVVLPLLVVAVPLTIFVERQNARQNRISRSFPDTLNALSSANRMGVGTTDALELVAKWSSGPIGRELRMVRNDIQWNHDTARALRAFADRLHVPQLSRSMKLVAEGMQSSSDLAKVLRIAAEDTRNRFRIEQQRRRELSSYVAVVVIGYLVYLLVVALLTTSYLEPVQAASEAAGAGAGAEMPEAPVSLTTLPVAAYELLFIHSAIIQAVGSGLIAGKLVENRALSGLKYSILLVVVAVIAFSLL